jgi:hypothetical protein
VRQIHRASWMLFLTIYTGIFRTKYIHIIYTNEYTDNIYIYIYIYVCLYVLYIFVI